MVASSNFLIPNATFIVELIAFLIILGILARYVVPPLQRMLAERQENIRKSLEEAEAGRELRRSAEAEYAAKVEEARREARSIIDQATETGERIRSDMQQRARAEYEALLSRAQADIDRSAERAMGELREQLADLVIETTRRVLGRELTPEIHRAIVEETTESVESNA
jgi:F-type H+-transporting ATPase subunit b